MSITTHEIFVLLWCLMSIWLVCCHGERKKTQDIDLDPFDILNFDPAHVRMKEKANDAEVLSQRDKIVLVKVEEPPSDYKLNRQPDEMGRKVATEEEIQSIPAETCGPLSALFKQYIKQLLNLLEPHVDEFSESSPLCVRMSVLHQDLDRLRQYTDSQSSNIHEVHESLSKMLQDAYKMTIFESRIFWLEEKLGLSSDSLKQISIIATSSAIVICVCLRFVQALPRMGIMSLIFLVFIVSVIFTWFEMFQKEQANQEKILSESIGNHCPSLAALPWYDRLASYVSSTFTFQDESCKEYYQATVVNPMFKVNPLEVCAVVLVKTVTTPLEIIGLGLKRFLVGLLKDLPLQFQMYLMLFLAVLVVLLPFLVCGYRIRVPFLLSIEPSPTMQIPATSVQHPGGNTMASLQATQDQSIFDSLPEQMAALSISSPEDLAHTLTLRKSVNAPDSAISRAIPKEPVVIENSKRDNKEDSYNDHKQNTLLKLEGPSRSTDIKDDSISTVCTHKDLNLHEIRNIQLPKDDMLNNIVSSTSTGLFKNDDDDDVGVLNEADNPGLVRPTNEDAIDTIRDDAPRKQQYDNSDIMDRGDTSENITHVAVNTHTLAEGDNLSSINNMKLGLEENETI